MCRRCGVRPARGLPVSSRCPAVLQMMMAWKEGRAGTAWHTTLSTATRQELRLGHRLGVLPHATLPFAGG